MYVAVVGAAAAWKQYIAGLVVVVDSRLVAVVSRQGLAVIAVVADVAAVSGVSESSCSKCCISF